jgi:transcriptional regulator with XRE-family HTH domain
MKDWNDLSAEIRKLRERASLSQGQLARRAGTSVATLSRYESGWTRFELYTLRKLAAALGCRLQVRFVPVRQSVTSWSREKLVQRLGRLFWDRPLATEDLDRYPRWVVERVVEYGTLEDVRGLISAMGRARFVQWVRRTRWQSPRTRAFWEGILTEETSCMKRRSRPQAGNFWTDWKR